jgi:hypothetical protein
MRQSMLAAAIAVFGCLIAFPAAAVPFADDQFFSFSQNTWGQDPAFGPPAELVKDHFDDIYPTGLTVGGANFILFTAGNGGDPVLTFLPTTGPAAALNATLVDPTSSSSGIFGGQVVGLAFNIDFSDAGFTLGSLGIPFGDLILHDLTGAVAGLNGDDLRQFLDVTNIALGGGNPGYAIADLSPLVMLVNGAFEGGFVNQFADDHLAIPAIASVDEPPSWLLLIAGIVLFAGALQKTTAHPGRCTVAFPRKTKRQSD